MLRSIAVIAVLVAVTCPNAEPQTGTDRRDLVFAVGKFKWTKVKADVRKIFQADIDLGESIRAVISKKLAETGRVRVIIVPAAQARTTDAQEVRSDLRLVGELPVFGVDDRFPRFRGATPPTFPRPVMRLPAVVVIAYRVLENRTGEVVLAGEAHGESRRSVRSRDELYRRPRDRSSRHLDMTTPDFAETIIGEATRNACQILVSELLRHFSRSTDTPPLPGQYPGPQVTDDSE
jgi:hypothetical protein